MAGWGEWPWEAIVAVAGLLLSNLALVGRWVWKRALAADGRETEVALSGWDRVGDRDKQIELLRRLLDRSRRRENAYATALELALLAMKLPEPEQFEVMARVRVILEAALPHSGKAVS